MTPIVSALVITALGMGIVFIGIVLLWGLMALMVRVFQEKPQTETAPIEAVEVVETAPEPAAAPRDIKRRAAAAAVAAALSLRRAVPALPAQSSAALSPWQFAARAGQMQQHLQLSTRKNRGLNR